MSRKDDMVFERETAEDRMSIDDIKIFIDTEINILAITYSRDEMVKHLKESTKEVIKTMCKSVRMRSPLVLYIKMLRRLYINIMRTEDITPSEVMVWLYDIRAALDSKVYSRALENTLLKDDYLIPYTEESPNEI